jgi:hypothetical protein
VFLGRGWGRQRVTFMYQPLVEMRGQIPPRLRYLRTVINTAWLYPRSNIDVALSTTTQAVTYDGRSTIVGSVDALRTLAGEIFENTAAELPSQGFNIGVGTLLEDLGQELTFYLPDGCVYLTWRLVRQLTVQGSLPSGGASPAGTVGFLPVFVAQGNIVGDVIDPVRVVRIG